MQPSSGEMPSSAQTPQNVNSSAMAMMSLLSVERFCGMSSFMRRPNTPPSASTPRFVSSGSTSVSNEKPCPPPDCAARATEMATE